MILPLEQLPTWFLNLMSVSFGLLIGSFVNVVVVRLPQGRSLVKPRSHCPCCQAPVTWWQNVPVLSFLLLRGKCAACGTKISLRYPVIELLVAFLFLVTQLKFGWSAILVLRDWPFVAMLVAITFIDLEHRIIPDPLSLGGLALGLLTAWFVPGFGLLQAVAGAAFGFGLFYGLAWLYHRFKGKMGLGGGDIKLIAMLGAFLGVRGVFTTILISSVLGSVIGILYAVLSRRGKETEAGSSLMGVAIPYGPFLVIGALFYYLLGDYVWFQSMIPM